MIRTMATEHVPKIARMWNLQYYFNRLPRIDLTSLVNCRVFSKAIWELSREFSSLFLSVLYLSALFRVTSGSAVEAVHESWINVKAWFNDGLDKAVIFPELHRGETHLIEHYITVLSEPEHLTDKVWRVLQEQLKSIKEQDASLYSL